MAKQKIRELISRATYKTIKSMNREEVNEFAKRIYLDALKDAAAAELTSLKDEFGFGTKRLAQFFDKRERIIDAINERELTADEILDGLRKKGIKIVDNAQD